MYQINALTLYMTLATSLRNISAMQRRLLGVHKQLKTACNKAHYTDEIRNFQ
jgi:hypothetical protein